MKKEFSTKWVGSSQVRKQRKYRVNAPIHRRAKMLASHLSKELREKHGKRSFPVRKGDEVKVMKGEFKSKKGKISMINLAKLKVAIEGIQRTKKDGTKVNVYLDPSNLQISELNLDDKKRIASLERKTATAKTEAKETKKTEVKKSEGDKK